LENQRLDSQHSPEILELQRRIAVQLLKNSIFLVPLRLRKKVPGLSTAGICSTWNNRGLAEGLWLSAFGKLFRVEHS
jgi:hypothetical protein